MRLQGWRGSVGFCGIRQGVCACGNVCASWSIAHLDSIELGCVCALDRAAFESGMVSVWIDEGSNILRRCFAGKDRLYCLRVRPRKPVFSDVVFACLIAYTFRRSLYRRCHMYAQTPSGKAECRRFDRLIGCGRRIKERIRLGKAQVG